MGATTNLAVGLLAALLALAVAVVILRARYPSIEARQPSASRLAQ